MWMIEVMWLNEVQNYQVNVYSHCNISPTMWHDGGTYSRLNNQDKKKQVYITFYFVCLFHWMLDYKWRQQQSCRYCYMDALHGR